MLKFRKAIILLDFSGEKKEIKVPAEIKDKQIKETLEEAIEDFYNECFDSSMVMCRRAYELTLFNLYVNEEKKIPVKHSNNFEEPLSLSELYEWFKRKHGNSQIVEYAGKIVKSFGDEAAHVPKPQSSNSLKKDKARSVLNDTVFLTKGLFVEFPSLSNIVSD
ncbi:MAG: hypothetical protein QXS47_00830 [Thermoplasmata archaeon]